MLTTICIQSNESGPQGRVTCLVLLRRHGRPGKRRIVETKPPVPRAILVGIQLPGVDDVAHAASIEEVGRLVNTLGYEVGRHGIAKARRNRRRDGARQGSA
jgi:hypothetical protein